MSEEAKFLKDKYSILFMQIKNTQINIIYYLWTHAKVVKVKTQEKHIDLRKAVYFSVGGKAKAFIQT